MNPSISALQTSADEQDRKAQGHKIEAEKFRESAARHSAAGDDIAAQADTKSAERLEGDAERGFALALTYRNQANDKKNTRQTEVKNEITETERHLQQLKDELNSFS